MDQSEFDRLVSEDVKNLISPEKADYLRMPSNQGRWLKSLTKLMGNLDEQVDGLKQDEITVTKNMPSHLITEYKTESDEKRTKISRFRFYVTQRAAEAERMIALGEDHQDPDLKFADFLTKAITQHKEMMTKYDFEPTPIDRALWKATEGQWAFAGIATELEDWN